MGHWVEYKKVMALVVAIGLINPGLTLALISTKELHVSLGKNKLFPSDLTDSQNKNSRTFEKHIKYPAPKRVKFTMSFSHVIATPTMWRSRKMEPTEKQTVNQQKQTQKSNRRQNW